MNMISDHNFNIVSLGRKFWWKAISSNFYRKTNIGLGRLGQANHNHRDSYNMNIYFIKDTEILRFTFEVTNHSG